MGLALAAVRIWLSNSAHDLTTMPTHKVGAEIAPFVCIDESAVSATLIRLSLHLKNTLFEKVSISIPKSEPPDWGFQNGRNRYLFMVPIFCRFRYLFEACLLWVSVFVYAGLWGNVFPYFFPLGNAFSFYRNTHRSMKALCSKDCALLKAIQRNSLKMSYATSR